MLQKTHHNLYLIMKVHGTFNWYMVINSRSWQLIIFSLIHFFKLRKCCHIHKTLQSLYNIYINFYKYKQKTKKQRNKYSIIYTTYNFFMHRKCCHIPKTFPSKYNVYIYFNKYKQKTDKETHHTVYNQNLTFVFWYSP